MNTPNKLTVFRFCITPVYLLFFLWNFPYHYFAALLVFIIASITDYIDGQMARKQGLVTDFGKFLDPLADKMLTTAAFLGFLAKGIGAGMVWIVFIVLLREFVVTSLRLVAASSGTVIAAAFLGKLKTVLQMAAIIVTVAAEGVLEILESIPEFPKEVSSGIQIGCSVLLWLSAVAAVVSGIQYLYKNRSFFQKMST